MIRFMLLLSFVLAQTGGDKEIPRFEGDGEGRHYDQPAWCQKDGAGGYRANCGECEARCDGSHLNNPKCKVNCRPRACKCHSECIPTGHRMNKLDPNYREATP
jgi:hypothetical protein